MFDVFYIGNKPNLFVHECEVESIEQAQQQSRTGYFWMVSYLVDYTGFNFLWKPAPWQGHQCHAWPSQWQKDSGTYLAPKSGYFEINYRKDQVLTRLQDRSNWVIPDNFDADSFDFSWHPDTTEPDYVYQFGTQHQRTGGPKYCVAGAIDLKFCDQVRGSVKSGTTPIIEINHLDGNAGQVPGVVSTVRYFDNYKDTLARIANTCEHEYVWIVSSICDYSNFDFSWHPELWQNTMLHVFASDEQKFGDTFYMHVPSFQKRIDQFALLDWYDLNFVSTGVPRRPMPIVQHDQDSHADVIRTRNFAGPLAVFTQSAYMSANLVTVSLWREQTKTIVPLNPGASSVIVPRTAVPYIKTQLYDYPYVDKTHRVLLDPRQDIVFISNGETNAEDNWTILESRIIGLETNKLHRVDRVNGRAAAYHAAAQASTTPWFFAVFGKLAIDLDFDWAWQPDRMQQAKHYIFHARNPVNGLIYGHQAMIAYNKQLVLDNPGVGLDFTLDSPHEVVPILSGVAYYDTSAWSTWRTAFREVLKLQASLPDVENEYRLNKWLDINSDETDPQWSRLGAEDAVEYYNQVNGDFAALKKSYEWEWLASYAFVKRSLLPSQ
jgi:hypothetical protein